MRQLLGWLALFVIIFFIGSCANIVNPSGGAKDETAPQIVASSPENGSVNFNSNEIRIEFNEFIQLNDIYNQVVISPPVNEMPDFKLRGKKVIITFKSSLNDSTTYTINFGQAISDITENNIIQNLTYVFSTGSFLDSLQVSGSITELLTSQVVNNAFAVLYFNPSDNSFLTEKPYYFARTDNMGNFSIKNIKQGTYRLYAIEDQNFNYFYDLPNERIAFQAEDLQVDSDIANQKLQLFSENKIRQQLIESKSFRYGQSRLVFAKATDSVVLNYTGIEPEKGKFIKNNDGDTIVYWHTNLFLTTHSFSISFDTTVLTRDITISKAIPADSNFQKLKNTFVSNVQLRKGNSNERVTIDLKQDIVLSFYNPLTTVNAGQIKIIIDTVIQPLPQVTIDSANTQKLRIKYSWIESTNYDIIIAGNATQDIFSLTNDADTLKVTTRKVTDYSTLKIALMNTTGSPLIFQLLDDDFQIIKDEYLIRPDGGSDSIPQNIVLEFLSPKSYKLRVIIDENGDRKWTTGDFIKNQQPEKVLLYPFNQNLRPNWENEVEWEIKY